MISYKGLRVCQGNYEDTRLDIGDQQPGSGGLKNLKVRLTIKAS